MREARLIPIVFKILSSGLALLVIVGSVGCSQNRHLQIDEPFRGLHHSLAESESGSLRILLVHGIGCHEPGYSDPVQRGITERLGLREIASRRTMIELAPQSREIQSWQRGNYVEPVKKDTLCKASDQPPALLSRTYQGGGQEVTFIEVTWSPISEALKDRELADEYLPAQRRRRALLNHWLKTSLVNDRLADAVVYLGQAQRDIQWVVQQGLCWMALEVSFDMTRHKALCSTRDRLQPRPDHFAIITESLGSRIVFDTLWSPDLKLTDLELLPRIGGVYMLANQLPLLELASDGKEAARVVERVSRRKFDDRLTDWLNELSERTDRTPTSLCVGGMEALEGDREAWEETVERQLDPRHRAQRVVRAENVHADRVAYHRRLVDERTEVAVRSSRTPSELNRLGGELSERERQLEAFDAVAERKANELARAEAAREQERRKHEAVEGTQQRLRQLQQLHRALSGELASELLSAATSLTEIIRLESRLVEFQKAALVVRTGLELNQTWLQGLDTVRRNIRHENDLLVDALTVARGHLEELRDNQAQASLECTKECKDTLEELAKAVRDYRALYAKLDLKNSKLVRTREQLAEATSTAKELDQAGALARFATAKRDVERLSDSVDEAKELRRRMKVELEILRKRHDEL